MSTAWPDVARFTVTDPTDPHTVVYDGPNPAGSLVAGTYPASWTDDDGTTYTGTCTVWSDQGAARFRARVVTEQGASR